MPEGLLQEINALDKNKNELTMRDLLLAVDKGYFDAEENLQKISRELETSKVAERFKALLVEAKSKTFANTSKYFDRTTSDGMYMGEKLVVGFGNLMSGNALGLGDLIDHVVNGERKKDHQQARQATKIDVLYERYVETKKQSLVTPSLGMSKPKDEKTSKETVTFHSGAEKRLVEWIRQRDPIALVDKIASLNIIHQKHPYNLRKDYIERDILLYAIQRYQSEVELELLQYRRKMGYTSETQLEVHAEIYTDYVSYMTEKVKETEGFEKEVAAGMQKKYPGFKLQAKQKLAQAYTQDILDALTPLGYARNGQLVYVNEKGEDRNYNAAQIQQGTIMPLYEYHGRIIKQQLGRAEREVLSYQLQLVQEQNKRQHEIEQRNTMEAAYNTITSLNTQMQALDVNNPTYESDFQAIIQEISINSNRLRSGFSEIEALNTELNQKLANKNSEVISLFRTLSSGMKKGYGLCIEKLQSVQKKYENKLSKDDRQRLGEAHLLMQEKYTSFKQDVQTRKQNYKYVPVENRPKDRATVLRESSKNPYQDRIQPGLSKVVTSFRRSEKETYARNTVKAIDQFEAYQKGITKNGVFSKIEQSVEFQKKLLDPESKMFPALALEAKQQKQRHERKDARWQSMKSGGVPKKIAYYGSTIVSGLWGGASDYIVGTASGLALLLEGQVLSVSKEQLLANSGTHQKLIEGIKATPFLPTAFVAPAQEDGKWNLGRENTLYQTSSQSMNLTLMFASANLVTGGVLTATSRVGLKMAAATAGKIGMVSNAFMLSMAGYYKEAVQNSLSSEKALAYSLFMSTMSSGLELINPNLSSVVGPRVNLKTLLGLPGSVNTLGGSMKPFFSDFVLQFTKNMSKEMGQEAAQEVAQMLAENMGKTIFNNFLTGSEIAVEEITLADVTTTAYLTMLTTATVTGRNVMKETAMNMPPNHDDALLRYICKDEVRKNQYVAELTLLRDKIEKNPSREMKDNTGNLITVEKVDEVIAMINDPFRRGVESENSNVNKKSLEEYNKELEVVLQQNDVVKLGQFLSAFWSRREELNRSGVLKDLKGVLRKTYSTYRSELVVGIKMVFDNAVNMGIDPASQQLVLEGLKKVSSNGLKMGLMTFSYILPIPGSGPVFLTGVIINEFRTQGPLYQALKEVYDILVEDNADVSENTTSTGDNGGTMAEFEETSVGDTPALTNEEGTKKYGTYYYSLPDIPLLEAYAITEDSTVESPLQLDKESKWDHYDAGSEIESRETLSTFIQKPLLGACEMAYDKNIVTHGSDIRSGDGYIEIRMDKLSEENKLLLEQTVKNDSRFEVEYVNSSHMILPYVRIGFVKAKTTLELQRDSLDFMSALEKQPYIADKYDMHDENDNEFIVNYVRENFSQKDFDDITEEEFDQVFNTCLKTGKVIRDGDYVYINISEYEREKGSAEVRVDFIKSLNDKQRIDLIKSGNIEENDWSSYPLTKFDTSDMKCSVDVIPDIEKAVLVAHYRGNGFEKGSAAWYKSLVWKQYVAMGYCQIGDDGNVVTDVNGRPRLKEEYSYTAEYDPEVEGSIIPDISIAIVNDSLGPNGLPKKDAEKWVKNGVLGYHDTITNMKNALSIIDQEINQQCRDFNFTGNISADAIQIQEVLSERSAGLQKINDDNSDSTQKYIQSQEILSDFAHTFFISLPQELQGHERGLYQKKFSKNNNDVLGRPLNRYSKYPSSKSEAPPSQDIIDLTLIQINHIRLELDIEPDFEMMSQDAIIRFWNLPSQIIIQKKQKNLEKYTQVKANFHEYIQRWGISKTNLNDAMTFVCKHFNYSPDAFFRAVYHNESNEIVLRALPNELLQDREFVDEILLMRMYCSLDSALVIHDFSGISSMYPLKQLQKNYYFLQKQWSSWNKYIKDTYKLYDIFVKDEDIERTFDTMHDEYRTLKEKYASMSEQEFMEMLSFRNPVSDSRKEIIKAALIDSTSERGKMVYGGVLVHSEVEFTKNNKYSPGDIYTMGIDDTLASQGNISRVKMRFSHTEKFVNYVFNEEEVTFDIEQLMLFYGVGFDTAFLIYRVEFLKTYSSEYIKSNNNPEVQKFSEEQGYNSLFTPEELAYLRQYQTGYAMDMNHNLRFPDSSKNRNITNILNQKISSVVDKNKLTQEATLYRLLYREGAKTIQDKKIGDTITDGGFPSASFNDAYQRQEYRKRGGVMLKVRAPVGTGYVNMEEHFSGGSVITGGYGSALYTYTGQNEILLQKGTTYKITNIVVEEGGLTIYEVDIIQ